MAAMDTKELDLILSKLRRTSDTGKAVIRFVLEGEGKAQKEAVAHFGVSKQQVNYWISLAKAKRAEIMEMAAALGLTRGNHGKEEE